MSSGTPPDDEPHDQAASAANAQQPDWADGLRQLYDAVVDEPLPDAFKDLLDRLDEDGSNDSSRNAEGSDGSLS